MVLHVTTLIIVGVFFSRNENGNTEIFEMVLIGQPRDLPCSSPQYLYAKCSLHFFAAQVLPCLVIHPQNQVVVAMPKLRFVSHEIHELLVNFLGIRNVYKIFLSLFPFAAIGKRPHIFPHISAYFRIFPHIFRIFLAFGRPHNFPPAG